MSNKLWIVLATGLVGAGLLAVGLAVWHEERPPEVRAPAPPPPAKVAEAPPPPAPEERPEEYTEPAAPEIERGLIPSIRAESAVIRKLDAAREYLKTETWDEIAPLLQSLLDGTDDVFVAVPRPGTDGPDAKRWTGLRGEATRLLGQLPARGREFYETLYGPRARTMLSESRAKRDASLLAEVARRYPQTAAGLEAAALLAVYHLDRGRPALAAVGFARLLDRSDVGELPPGRLLHAALAFHRTGDRVRAEQAWKRLAARAPDGLRLGASALSLTALKAELQSPQPAPSVPVLAGAPRLESRWSRPTVHEVNARAWLEGAAEQQLARGEPVLPAAFPVQAGDRVVYRSGRGVHAVDLRTGKEAWAVPSAWSLDGLLAESRHAAHLDTLIQPYLDNNPHALFDNAVLGTLSTDGVRVYAVDDLALPPYRNSFRPRGRWRMDPDWPAFSAELNDAMYFNRLLALDAASGREAWAVGGRGGTPDAGELSDCHFLGPPLPLDDRLYVVAEKATVVTLFCLAAADGSLLWQQALAYPIIPLLYDPGRHLQAARPVFADGVLVCPTNAGLVVGVDLFTPGLIWAYPYRGELLTRAEAVSGRRGRASPTQIVAEWKAPRAAVERGRVVFTVPDESSIHCLNLHDGSLAWKAGRGDDDLYLAGVVAGRVLMVGKGTCRALDLESGRQVWRVATGLPSGIGVAGGDAYYLPVQEAGPKKEPAVFVIDVKKGVVRSRTPAPAKEVPGNLLVGPGGVFSQTARTVSGYPEWQGKAD